MTKNKVFIGKTINTMKKTLLGLSLLVFLTSASCNKNESTPPDNSTPATVDSAYTKTFTFKSLDSLTVTADIYHIGKDKPVMILCHQAGWSRGEYKESAPAFNTLGYNCIAVDLRSGNEINSIENETAKGYSPKGLPQDYVNAEQDIIAAVNYAHAMYGKNVILVGSSYSSGLVLKVAKENSKVDMVLSFSPDEYYGNMIDLRQTITGLDKPTFITSAKNEAAGAKALFDVVTASKKVQFIPQGAGYHGSRSLWASLTGNEEYWVAVRAFLGK